ncbi:MAG: Alcohol dehydrogenase zinc-binding domain protein [Candidatus Eremiobacteraeota bacterium]|nr:Alcohol dehydrogenase zinc-binding domain protein [Candidatus Eremiobacteraeota bacterium]
MRQAAPRPYAASRPIEIVEVELDPPGYGEVQVAVASVGVCHSDLSTVDGTFVRPVPLAIGHEAAGTVEAIGPGVSRVALGDKVVFSFVPTCGHCVACAGGRPALCEPGNRANAAGTLMRGRRPVRRDGQQLYTQLGVGGFAERTVCAEESLVRIPADTPLEIAALFGCAALTGLGAVLNSAQVEAGTSVAIFGAGGVGLMALFGAVIAGATEIVVVDPVAEKRALARELGATATVDPAAGDAAEHVRGILADRGADYAFEAAGNVSALESAYMATAPGGTTIAVGLPRSDATAAIPHSLLVRHERTLKGSFMGSAVPQRDIPRYIALWRSGRLPVERLISGTIGLDGINGALDALAEGRTIRTLCAIPS